MTNSTLTVQDRFNLAIEGIRAEGIKVVINHEGGMSYEHGDLIAYTECFPALEFNKDGNPVFNTENEFMTFAGPLEKVVFQHIGDNHKTADAVAEQFKAQGFEVTESGSYYMGVIVHF